MDCTDLVIFSLSSPYNESLKLNERLFFIYSKNIILLQKYKSDGHGGTTIGFGASVYNSSIILSYYLESIQNQLINKTGIEIGCGPAFVSVSASLAKMKLIIATDGDIDSIQLASNNLERNCLEENNSLVKQLLWGNNEHIADVLDSISSFLIFDETNHVERQQEQEQIKPDFIFASDVVACPYENSYKDLVDTFLQLSAPHTIIYLTYQFRHVTEEKCFRLLRKHFSVTRLDRDVIHPDFHSSPIDIFELRRI